jgi:hypothetical protein
MKIMKRLNSLQPKSRPREVTFEITILDKKKRQAENPCESLCVLWLAVPSLLLLVVCPASKGLFGFNRYAFCG